MLRKSLSQRRRFAILERDNFTCQYCGRGAPEVKLHVDHIVAVARGGTDDESNLLTACRDCNFGKHTLRVNRERPDVLAACWSCQRGRLVHFDRKDLGVCAECLTFRRRPWMAAYLAWSRRVAA